MAKNQLVQDLIDKVQKISDSTLAEASKIVEGELEKARLQILSQFYEYTKDGSGDLFNAIKVKRNTTSAKNQSRAYMVIDSGGMADAYGNGAYQVSAGTVLDLIWNEGIRGLPQQGSKDLNKSYTYFGHHFEKGEPWVNPYWDQEKYHNEFIVNLQIGGFSAQGTPKDVMKKYIEDFESKRMDDVVAKAFGIASKG